MKFYDKYKEGHHLVYNILGFKLKFNNHPQNIFESVYQFIPNYVRDVVIVKQDMGEPYLLANFLDDFKKTHKIEKLFFIFGRKYHEEIFKMFCDDLNYICIPDIIPKLWDNIPNKIYRYKNKRFILYINQAYTRKLFKNILETKKIIPICNMIFKHYGINKKAVSFKYPKFSDDIIKSVNYKVQQINLNMDKFVILCPETVSLAKYNKTFWINIAEKLHTQGYDIYYNNINKCYDIPHSKYIQLSIRELAYLAQFAKGIISIRTGLCEVISQIKIPIFAIYTHFKTYKYYFTAAQTLEMYSLNNYPNVSSELINEYNTDKYDESEIIDNIVCKISNNSLL